MPLGSDPEHSSVRVIIDWQPLHPLSPILGAGRIGLVAMAFLAQQGIARAEPLFAAFGLIALIVIAAIASWVAWKMTRFRIDGENLELKSGLFHREHRRLPLARIEAVDVAQPVLPRLLGLAEVRVQSASSDDGELRLRYLSEPAAWQLRDRLRVAGGLMVGKVERPGANGLDDDVTDQTDQGVDEPRGRTLFEVSNGELIFGYLVARVAVPSVFLLLALGFAVGLGEVAALGGAAPFLIVIFTVVVNGLRTTEAMYGFTLYEHPDGLFIHRGLLNKLTQRVSLDRVQSVAIQQPLLWRRFGRARLLLDVAGYKGRGANEAEQTALLVPIARYRDCLNVLNNVLPGLRFDDIALRKAPKQACWLEPVGARRLFLGANDLCAVSSFGVLRRMTIVVPHKKVQSWRLSSGPWQRRLGLATLQLDTAGDHILFAARFRERAEAEELLNTSRLLSHDEN